MNPCFLADPDVSRIYVKNRIFEKYNSLEEWTRVLSSSFPASIFDRAGSAAERISSEVTDLGFSVLTGFDPEYPSLLKQIYDPPAILFHYGNVNVLQERLAAVVGTREPSPVSKFVCELLPSYLKTHNVSGIVSGLAKGIDVCAMSCALKRGMKVIGVMGTGPENEYPWENKDLYRDMKRSENALILTEYPPGHRPLKYSFPKRNRIITGLCESVFIMEAPEKSGAISSAYNALDQNRQIYVFSHPAQTKNGGGEILIRDGAERLDLETISFGREEIVYIEDLLPESQSEIPGMLAELSEKRFSGEWKPIGSGYYARKTYFQPGS
ncbi:DNA-processing protein DprA [Leptospira gomenensis]|uniref:DNA-processing protein DprA n=1 Tax=Leptospira gomenensis TaxID=2484974 RepID=A0A5F1YKK9_9LEPT|nr:DNA-processing protein DprA [Leptospira gomenensis]TGK34376.1 DNA-processing protein DprA [Leptospira gomenensis]TGK37264.1 DNA-processing protein DprA [Leptospira gomenensis]TGK50951.1 DNA-processing protein DprA [Leptospira gomenensis]TGK56573.1 DNA-processing protein DprA [Leptospira gomenensis]